MISPNPDDFSPSENQKSRDPAPERREESQAPDQDGFLTASFQQFSETRSRTLLTPAALAKIWGAVEPKLRLALWGSTAEPTQASIVFRPISGASLNGNEAQLLIALHDARTGDYILPTPTRIHTVASPEAEAGAHWVSYGRFGAALLLTAPTKEKPGKPLSLGFSYALSPAALELDEGRLVSADTASIIAATIDQVIQARTGRPAAIEMIERWHPPGTDARLYRFHEEDGTRHMLELSGSVAGVTDGIVHFETIPSAPTPPQRERGSHSVHQVGLRFEDFHAERGFHPADPTKFFRDYPDMPGVIENALRSALPNVQPEWRFEVNRLVEKKDEVIMLVGFYDADLNSFVPGDLPTGTVQDKVFSGILVSVHHELEPAPRAGLHGKAVDLLGKLIPAIGSSMEPVMHIDIVGPVLSEHAWLEHLGKLLTAPRESLLYPAIEHAVETDLAERGLADGPTTISRIIPLRTTRGTSTLQNLIVSVDHSAGTHIIHIPREPSMGLIAFAYTGVQQFFPLTDKE